MAQTRRHPHEAEITIQTGRLEKGEWVGVESRVIHISGIYASLNNFQQRRKNADGNEFIVRGEFSCRHEPVKDAIHIRICSIGLDEPIQVWEKYQVHSVIYV